MRRTSGLLFCVAMSAVLAVTSRSWGQSDGGAPGPTAGNNASSSHRWQPMSIARSDDSRKRSAPQPKDATHETGTAQTKETKETKETTETSDKYGYHEVSDFFNIREANPQVGKCEWEFELEGGWNTHSNHHDDTFWMEQSIKYGITDDIFVELEVVEPSIGDGADQGNGDLNLTFFQRVLKENECQPAIGLQEEMRIPTGDGSSGVDGTLSLIFTKHLCEKVRAHFEGWIETANGAVGAGDDGGSHHGLFGRGWCSEDDEGDRRHFQWGVGPGFDYQLDECTMLILNYLNRSSEDYGHHNQNILELGATRQICKTACSDQLIKAAIDIGLDGQEETPNFGVKFMWEIGWK